MKILVINPGSTTTKIAVFDDETCLMVKSINHSADELLKFEKVMDQCDFRLDLINKELRQAGYDLDFDAVIGRGLLARPVRGGVYPVTEKMLNAAWSCKHQHAADLGCIIADRIARNIPGCQCYIADPGTVDELNDYARISGSPHCPRIAIWHALNQRAIARRFAKDIGRRYEDINLIICHLGGGISIAAHDHGLAVDANNALDGEGPFSPERAGSLPSGELIKLCFSGKYTEQQLLKRIAGKAGLTAHLGTNDTKEIIRRIEAGDENARLIVDAMVYHVAKNIAAEGAVLFGKVDAVLLTGGMAHSDYIIGKLKPRIEWIAPVYVYPGEGEMEALAANALAALRGECQLKEY